MNDISSSSVGFDMIIFIHVSISIVIILTKSRISFNWNWPFIGWTCFVRVMPLFETPLPWNRLIFEDICPIKIFLLVLFKTNEVILLNVKSNYTRVSLGWKTTTMGLLQKEHISSYEYLTFTQIFFKQTHSAMVVRCDDAVWYKF